MGAGSLRLQPRETAAAIALQRLGEAPRLLQAWARAGGPRDDGAGGHSPWRVPGAPPHLLPEAEGLEGWREGRLPPLTTLSTEENTAPPTIGRA